MNEDPNPISEEEMLAIAEVSAALASGDDDVWAAIEAVAKASRVDYCDLARAIMRVRCSQDIEGLASRAMALERALRAAADPRPWNRHERRRRAAEERKAGRHAER